MFGNKFYDTFPRALREIIGQRITSSESNVVFSPDYVRIGYCSFKRNYNSQIQPDFQCSSSCE